MTSRRATVVTCLLGTSMPTTAIFSGMAEMRTPTAPRARAMSSWRAVTLARRTPWASSTSYRVTEGPRVTLQMRASILKLCRASFRRRVFSRISAVPSVAPPGAVFSRLMGGK